MKQFIISAAVIGIGVMLAACGNAGAADGSSADKETEQESQVSAGEMYTRETKISDVINDEIFADYGRLIFPVEPGYYSGDTHGH